MATYQSDQLINNVPGPYHGIGGDVQRIFFTVTLAAAPVTTDTINFGYVPRGFRLNAATLQSTDMDSGTTLTLNVGDAGLATRIFSASPVAQTAGFVNVIQNSGMFYKYPDVTLITGTAQANATGGAAGVLTLALFGVFEANPLT